MKNETNFRHYFGRPPSGSPGSWKAGFALGADSGAGAGVKSGINIKIVKGVIYE